MREILKSATFYKIPRFQRPFSWDTQNIEDFWRDAIELNEPGYFIGPMVAYQMNSSTIGIVDGQQRLTTVTILLACLRDELWRLDSTYPGTFAKLARGVHDYIERKTDEDELRFVLESEEGGTYTRNQIQSFPEKAPATASTAFGDRAAKVAAELFRKKIKDIVDGAIAGTAQVARKRDAAKKALVALRDQALGLQVIWVGLEKVDDAYLIFETLNSRGKDLEVADLLKNLLLGRLRSAGSVDTFRERWDQMRLTVERGDDGGRVDFSKFLLHQWLSKHEYVAERRLYSAIRPTIDKNTAGGFLSELEADAPIYRRIALPESANANSQPGWSSLSALALFGIRQPAPLLLALMRQHDLGILSARSLEKSLRTLENYHFTYTVISGLSSSGGVSEMFAKTAREVSTATDTPSIAEAMSSLRTKLQDRLPSKDVFIAGFLDRMKYSDASGAGSRGLVEYALRRIMLEGIATPATTTFDDYNIEHILCQSDGRNAGLDQSVYGSIGNLLLVPTKVNDNLKCKAFGEKKRILARIAGGLRLSDVLGQSSWTSAEIEARALSLAELGFGKIWAL